MQRRLATVNLSDLDPSPLVFGMFATHPTAPQRIALARTWAARAPRRPCRPLLVRSSVIMKDPAASRRPSGFLHDHGQAGGCGQRHGRAAGSALPGSIRDPGSAHRRPRRRRAALRRLGSGVSSYGHQLDHRVAAVAIGVEGEVGASLTRAWDDLARALDDLADGFETYGARARSEIAARLCRRSRAELTASRRRDENGRAVPEQLGPGRWLLPRSAALRPGSPAPAGG